MVCYLYKFKKYNLRFCADGVWYYTNDCWSVLSRII